MKPNTHSEPNSSNNSSNSRRDGLAAAACYPRKIWYVCELDKYNTPDWSQADGPHEDKPACERTIALMKRLNCIKDESRVICEVVIHEGTENPEGLNTEAIKTLNSLG